MKVELTPDMIQALLALCDGVPLRGPESKIVVARAQAALIEALQEGQPHGPLRAPAPGKTAPDAGPDDRSANPAGAPGRRPSREANPPPAGAGPQR